MQLCSIDGGCSEALISFACSLSELVKCVQVVGRGVVWSGACLVRHLMFVQRWVESVKESLTVELVQTRIEEDDGHQLLYATLIFESRQFGAEVGFALGLMILCGTHISLSLYSVGMEG